MDIFVDYSNNEDRSINKSIKSICHSFLLKEENIVIHAVILN